MNDSDVNQRRILLTQRQQLLANAARIFEAQIQLIIDADPSENIENTAQVSANREFLEASFTNIDKLDAKLGSRMSSYTAFFNLLRNRMRRRDAAPAKKYRAEDLVQAVYGSARNTERHRRRLRTALSAAKPGDRRSLIDAVCGALVSRNIAALATLN